MFREQIWNPILEIRGTNRQIERRALLLYINRFYIFFTIGFCKFQFVYLMLASELEFYIHLNIRFVYYQKYFKLLKTISISVKRVFKYTILILFYYSMVEIYNYLQNSFREPCFRNGSLSKVVKYCIHLTDLLTLRRIINLYF